MRKPLLGFRSLHNRQRGLPRKSGFELKPKFRMLRSLFDRNSIHKLPRVLPANPQNFYCYIDKRIIMGYNVSVKKYTVYY